MDIGIDVEQISVYRECPMMREYKFLSHRYAHIHQVVPKNSNPDQAQPDAVRRASRSLASDSVSNICLFQTCGCGCVCVCVFSDFSVYIYSQTRYASRSLAGDKVSYLCNDVGTA